MESSGGHMHQFALLHCPNLLAVLLQQNTPALKDKDKFLTIRVLVDRNALPGENTQIGRASCRERV